MAYDPNDPADKATVQALIDAALEGERESHTAEVERLNGKNQELLGKLTKARKDGGGESTEEIAGLERQLSESQRDLATAKTALRETERKLTTITGERDSAVGERDSERNFSQSQLIENSLNSALAEAKVAPHFMDAAKALLGKSLKVEVDGEGKRTVLADGKDVGEFVKTWAAGDAGKHYTIAPANGGGGASGANGTEIPNGGKALADYSEAERTDMARNRPDEWKAVQAAAGITTGDNANAIIN